MSGNFICQISGTFKTICGWHKIEGPQTFLQDVNQAVRDALHSGGKKLIPTLIIQYLQALVAFVQELDAMSFAACEL